MSAARESSIASSRQASPHAEVPTVPEEPINPEIAVLPVAPSSPVASSSPEANEPVPKPDELEGDEETPTKPKKGGKPSPLPVFQHLGRLLTKLNQSLVRVHSRLHLVNLVSTCRFASFANHSFSSFSPWIAKANFTSHACIQCSKRASTFSFSS
ncbi:hypothetical protein C8J56DRAFT_884066 [Mycena floridula]|nr:hypothetical protein C8J56DRAFT_884066 [Mycena floridula]